MRLDVLFHDIASLGFNLYDMALITPDGLFSHTFQPCSICHNSYSVAKVFTATAVGLLFDGGLISPDDRIADFFAIPAHANPRWYEVTIGHLLRHQSGIDHGFLDIDAEDTTQWPTDDYLSIVFAQPLPHAPGSLYLIDCEDAHMFVSSHDAPMTIYTLIFRPGFFDQTLLGQQSFSDVLHHFLLRSFQNDQFTHSLSVRFGADDFLHIARLFEDMYRKYETHQALMSSFAPGRSICWWIFSASCPRHPTPPQPLARSKPTCSIRSFPTSSKIIAGKTLNARVFEPEAFQPSFQAAHAGCTVTEYTQRLRVSHACTLLTDTPQPSPNR